MPRSIAGGGRHSALLKGSAATSHYGRVVSPSNLLEVVLFDAVMMKTITQYTLPSGNYQQYEGSEKTNHEEEGGWPSRAIKWEGGHFALLQGG